MITKEEYQQISAQWEDEIYQNWKRIKERLTFFCEFVDVFKDKNVIEFGSNAGIYGYEIAKVARSYVGVEMQKVYHKQALVTSKYIENKNIMFLNKTVKDFINRMGEYEFNALFMSFTLYHLSDEEIEMIKSMMSKCDIVFIQTRCQKRRIEKNSYKFWKAENVKRYLKEAGFKVKTHWHESKKFFETIGTK